METYESLHKEYVKTPYRLSNKKDIEIQIMKTVSNNNVYNIYIYIYISLKTHKICRFDVNQSQK